MAKSEKILLVLDQEEDQSFLESSLAPYALNRVSAPELFSEKILAQKFSLILFQLKCPIFSEYELVEILRKNNNFGKTPIIFLSDSAEVKAIHQKGYKLPLIDFLYAPYTQDAIQAKVKTFFNTEVLRNSGEQFWLITETIPQLVWRSNPDGSHDYFSQRFLKYVGYRSQQMLGWGWAEVIHHEDRPRVLEEWNRCHAEGKALSVEFRVKSANGLYRWFLSQGEPLRDSDGHIIKYYGTWTDIDQQKKSHAEIERALDIRDEFLSIASHELKTPLTSLKLQLQMTQRNFKLESFRADPLKAEKAVELAIEQVKRLENLVDSLLDITRIRAGKVNYEFSEVNLSKILTATMERFSQQFVESKCPVEMEIDPSIILSCDPFRIEQVITNLLTNAIKYGGGTKVNVRLERDGEFAKLSVKDHGMGIEKEKQARIFERFERAVSSNNIGGLGLGLFIVSQILEAHKATIDVESEITKGSTFIVRLPIG